MKRLLPAIISLLLVLGCIVYLFLNPKEEEIEIVRSDMYVASAGLSVPIYSENDNLLHKYKDLPRGTAVISRNRDVDVNNGDFVFTEIELEGENDENGNSIVYYISSTNLTDVQDDVVRETVKYVRTPVTVYEQPDDAGISSFLKKGTALSICGYYNLGPDGSVEMYQIDNEGSEGYVYAKYLVDTQAEADAVFSQIASIHADRKFEYELYGGSPMTLDWYPVDKPVLEQGPIPEDTRAIYLNADAMYPGSIDSYITLGNDAKANAFVVDIKNGVLTYAADAAKDLCPTAYDNAFLTSGQFASSMQKLKDAGFYLIGRIVVFNDSDYAADHPKECIESDVSEEQWPSPYSRSCWYYNVALALEAARTYGFNEIQFDYLRFPENAYYMSSEGETDFKNTYKEDKADAIQNFCFYAADQLHREGIYMSVDVFGECVNEYVTAYGQYWPAISNVVDVISGMPYTDHFGEDNDTWSDPYATMYDWSGKALKRQNEIQTPAIARTWITGYDTPHWNPVVTYGEAELTAQAQALYDAGLTGGIIPWNVASDLNKYYSYLAVWGKKY